MYMAESWITKCGSWLIYELLPGKEILYVIPITSILGKFPTVCADVGTAASQMGNSLQTVDLGTGDIPQIKFRQYSWWKLLVTSILKPIWQRKLIASSQSTTGTIPIDIVAPIILTGTLPVLILLQAVEMAAQCILWTLGPCCGRGICKWREYLV